MDVGVLLIVLFVWAICGFVCALIASGKGRNGLGWFAVGFLFGPIGVLVSLLIDDSRTPVEKEVAKARWEGREPVLPAAARPPAPTSAAPSVADELTKLAELLRAGHLTQGEFDAQKARLLG